MGCTLVEKRKKWWMVVGSGSGRRRGRDLGLAVIDTGDVVK